MLEAYGLIKRIEHSIIDRQALWPELERVRKEGVAFDREDSMLGGLCIGAPIRDADGRVIAALSVSTPIQRIPPDREKQVQEGVLRVAQAVSAALLAANG